MKRRGRMEEYEVEPGEICEYPTRAFTGQSSQAYPATAPRQTNYFGPPRFDTAAGPSRNKKKNKKAAKFAHQFSPENNVSVTEPAPAAAPAPVLTPKPTTPSVSSCYIFKSRLQEYAQRAQLETPIYETIKEGPPHEPIFSSSVIVNGVRYDSLPGFFNRKASEQSAAEVALSQLSHSVDMKFGIAVPVSETGLSKNLLQEYAQKMNYAVPLYDCSRMASKKIMYSCTVDVGGTKYIGAPASTKKEAEIKAARVALLAIQSATSEDLTGKSVHVVIPQKKKPSDIGISTPDTVPKPKKGNKNRKRKYNNKRGKKASGEEAGAELVETNPGGLDMEAIVNDSNTGVFAEFVVPLNGGDFENGPEVKVLDKTDSLVVDMDVQESGVTDDVNSQEKAIGLGYLYKATHSEVGHMETAENKGIEENALNIYSEALHKETQDIKTEFLRPHHDMSDADRAVAEAELELSEMDIIIYANNLVSTNEGDEVVLKDESDIKMVDQYAGLSSFTDADNKGIDENPPDKQNGAPELDPAELELGKAVDDYEELIVTTEGVSKVDLDIKICNQESGLDAFGTIADDFVMCMTEKGGIELGATNPIISLEKANKDSEELDVTNVC